MSNSRRGATHSSYTTRVRRITVKYLTIGRRRRGDYKPIFTEPKAKCIINNIYLMYKKNIINNIYLMSNIILSVKYCFLLFVKFVNRYDSV